MSVKVCHKFQLILVQGDITVMNAEALVHPTNSSLAMMGDVGQALEKKGGKEFLQVIMQTSCK